MSKLIALCDGHGMETAGKRTPILPDGLKSETGNFMHENEFNRAVVRYLDGHLKRSGFRTIIVAPTDADTSLATRVSTANNAKADLYVSVHANANTGVFGTWGGTETFTYPSGASLSIGKIIHKHLMKGTPLRDRGVKNGDWLYVIKNTSMPAVLVECAYMDNLEEAKLLLSDAFRRECAREIAMGICEAYGVAFKDEVVTPPTPTQPSTFYRVRLNWTDASTQKGAFQELSGAKALADSLKAQGDYRVFDEKGVVVYDPTPEKNDNVWYRVRKTWTDASSQIGAFHELEGARELADSKVNEGYKVFDESGTAVYVPKVVVEQPKPVEPTPPPVQVEPTPVPTPVVPTPAPEPKPEPIPTPPPVDHTNHKPIMGEVVIAPEKMVAFVKVVNPDAQDIEEIAKQFVEVGNKYGVRGDIAFCQSLIETGYFKFDGGTAVTPDQHNYCGMGVTSKGMKGNSFETVKDGVTAQIQHLLAYASKDELPEGETLLDPRFKYVKREVAPHWEDLSNRWAMNDNYGTHILSLYNKLLDYNYIPPVVEEEMTKEEEKQFNFFKRLIDYLVERLVAVFKGGK
jgi:N-acetylmuramoyl-L-alanine amidase